MSEEWNLATQNARRAFLAGNEEEINRIAEVAANQFKEFKSLLGSLQNQLLAGSSKESSEALNIVEQQQKKYNGKELGGLEQVNLNLNTVKIIMKAHTLVPTAIFWESIENKISSLLEELKSAGI
ncbi:uncharacterized protein [Anabrus simplex]|uniref:uncharacterized protein n=1 Tax=Anabrus simplex TaxID=316456 RepID=UPI0035A2F928